MKRKKNKSKKSKERQLREFLKNKLKDKNNWKRKKLWNKRKKKENLKNKTMRIKVNLTIVPQMPQKDQKILMMTKKSKPLKMKKHKCKNNLKKIKRTGEMKSIKRLQNWTRNLMIKKIQNLPICSMMHLQNLKIRKRKFNKMFKKRMKIMSLL